MLKVDRGLKELKEVKVLRVQQELRVDKVLRE